MLSSMWKFWRVGWKRVQKIWIWTGRPFTSNRIMNPSTHQKRPKLGLNQIKSMFWTGLHNLQISILLNTFGITSKGNFSSTPPPLLEFMDYGSGWYMNGKVFQLKFVKI